MYVAGKTVTETLTDFGFELGPTSFKIIWDAEGKESLKRLLKVAQILGVPNLWPLNQIQLNISDDDAVYADVRLYVRKDQMEKIAKVCKTETEGS